MRLVGHVAQMEELKNKYKILMGKRTWLLLGPSIVCDNNIIMEDEYDVRMLVGCIGLRKVDQWRESLNALIKLRIL